MIRLLIILFYKYFNLLSFFNFIFICYVEHLIITLLSLIMLLFFYKIIFFVQIFFLRKIQKIKISFYIVNIMDYFISIFIIFLFFIFYFLFLRLFIFFSKRNLDINFYEIKNNILLYCYSYSVNYYLIILFILLLLMIFAYIIIFIAFQLFFFFSKYFFLKIHFFRLRRIKKYNFFLEKLYFLELYFSELFCGYYYYFFFFRKYIMFSIALLLLCYCFIFCDGNLRAFLAFIPYYSLYQFFLNIYIFMAIRFKIDFEILIMEFYYKNIDYPMEKNEFKKLEYKRYLLTNFSKYKFVDSVYFYFPSEIKQNYLLVQTNKYTINKFPNDFFSKIYKIKK